MPAEAAVIRLSLFLLCVAQMARILSNAELAGFYEAYYAAKGIKLVKKTLAKEFKGEQGQVIYADLDLVTFTLCFLTQDIVWPHLQLSLSLDA